jgi:hypothetical protein
VNGVRRTVGAHQWLIVGALQQSTESSLPMPVIYQHMAPWLFPSEVRAAMLPLVSKGLVVVSRDGQTVSLTEVGADARRSVGKSSVPYFWALILPVSVGAE